MTVKTIVGYYDSNTFIVRDRGAVLVIDAGAKLDDLEKVLGGKTPDAILLTHEHFDHVYYLKDYREAFDCPVYAPTDERDIVVGDVTVKVMLCPGHSPQSAVYQIGGALFTGDVLFCDTIGRTDFMPNGAKLMQQSLKRLVDVKFEIAYHGHYDSSTYDKQQKNIRRFIRA